jgi:transposase
MTATARHQEFTGDKGVLYMALELGWSQWKLGFVSEAGQKPRQQTIAARDLVTLQREIVRAKARFGLADSSQVVSCFEAGRDGFWLHRYLESVGVKNRVVDSASIEMNRRARQAKSDGVDVQKLLSLLVRSETGERVRWSVVRVPSIEEEDGRQLSRELETLKRERTAHSNRMRGLLASQGVDLKIRRDFLEKLQLVRLWDGSSLSEGLRGRFEREWERLELLEKQIADLEKQRRDRVSQAQGRVGQVARRLCELKSIGLNSAWLFSGEFFAWRQFRNRKQVGSLAGLAPTPYQSGDRLHREQGISRAGNERVRNMAIEIAWAWLRFQPRSQLSLWFQERFGKGGSRSRRIGIVALARKLLVALWRYLETGQIPDGAELKASL